MLARDTTALHPLVYSDPEMRTVMNTDTRSAHITPPDGNVFSDLGFDREEATVLKDNVQCFIQARRATEKSASPDTSNRASVTVSGKPFTPAG